MDISNLEETTWWIGAKRKEAEVTQSITFFLHLPKLKEDDLKYLVQQKEVDSWMVRVILVKGSKEQDLGSLTTPFFSRLHGARPHQSASGLVAIKIYYAAAYASERLRRFNCPAFAHDKRVNSMTVKGAKDPFDINVGSFKSYQDKPREASITPNSFNGGNSLQGEFHFEIAPYSAKKQGIIGDFKRIPRYVEVMSEESIDTKSCKGLHPELN